MPVTKQQFDAVMQVARVNPGIKVDLPNSTRYSIRLVNGKLGKAWIIDHAGGYYPCITTQYGTSGCVHTSMTKQTTTSSVGFGIRSRSATDKQRNNPAYAGWCIE